jgi:hypothetical protein
VLIARFGNLSGEPTFFLNASSSKFQIVHHVDLCVVLMCVCACAGAAFECVLTANAAVHRVLFAIAAVDWSVCDATTAAYMALAATTMASTAAAAQLIHASACQGQASCLMIPVFPLMQLRFVPAIHANTS